jgi:hypothetical protein
VNDAAGEAVNSADVPVQRVTALTTRSAVPVFCTAAVCVAELPTVTVPNASEVGWSATFGCGTVPATTTVTATFSHPWFALLVSAVQLPNVAPEESYLLPYHAPCHVYVPGVVGAGAEIVIGNAAPGRARDLGPLW